MNFGIDYTNHTSNGGFLSGYVESSVEKPADGLNGECTIHYSGRYSKYEMIVPLVNGKRDGKAMIVNDGMPYLRLEYRRGSLTGVVERMNEFGAIELRGHLVNGVENGFFEEYDGSENVVWRGYYRNGRRDPESCNRLARKGENTVRSIERGEFYELDENGRVTQLCLYENGVRSRVIATFNGNRMTELDSNGKRVYEGEFNGNVENGFVREGKGREYAKGGKTVEYLGDWKNGKRNGVGTELKGIKTVYIGEWKDGMKDGKGKEMDENGNVVYEGEWWNGKRNAMGYERDGNGVMKRGCLFENGRMKRVVQEFDGGKMVEYDENGRKVYEGEYKGSVEKGFVREGFGKEFRWIEEKITSRAEPTTEIEKKRYCCWVREIEHEEEGVELVTKKYREEVVEGYWKDGKKNGMIYELDENGKAERGCLYEHDTMIRVVIEFKGSEMVEYDENGKRVYEGKWFGDMRSGFFCHEPMEGMSGFFKEVDSEGWLICVSEYDELNLHKNGKCFEMEDGKVKRVCVYENGRMKRVEQEFNGSTMTEYNNGKRTYQGGFKGDLKSGFARDGKGYELDENGKVKRVYVHENGRMKRVVQEYNGGNMIEYDENGKKVYEGGFNGFVRNGYGYCFDVDGKDLEFCLYENGKLKLMIQVIKGNEMTEYDENGKKVYEGGYSGDMKNGFARNGNGKELDGYGNVMYEGEWRNGMKNGRGKEMDASGRRVFVGEWKNGKKNGKIYEFDGDGIVVKICLYENSAIQRVMMEFHGSIMIEFNIRGKKVYEGEFTGDMESGFVRNGRGSEFQEGVLKQVGVYRNGKMKRVMQKFNGPDMTEYDENGKKVYEGEYGGDSVHGFVRSGNGEEYRDGNVVYTGEWKNGVRNGKGYCFEGNGSDIKLCLFSGGSVIRVIVEINGSVMTEYDDNGKKKYVGGFKGDWKNGFVRNGEGKEMDGNGRVLFAGEWKEGKKREKVMNRSVNAVFEREKKNGEGKEMNGSDRVVRSGKWVDGEHQMTVIPSSLTSNPSGIEELKTGNNCYNDNGVTELRLSGLARLKRIEIGDKCLRKVRVVELDDLGGLESVMIGKGSFRISGSKRNDGSCRIVNCPTLKFIKTAYEAFEDYHSFELNNLPSLQSIEICGYCFHHTSSFSLTGLIDGLD